MGSVCCGKDAWIGFSSLGTGTWEPLLELARHWFQYRRATGFVAAAIAAGEGAPGVGFFGAWVIEIWAGSFFGLNLAGTTSGMKHLPGGALGKMVTLQARSFFAMISSSFLSMSISTPESDMVDEDFVLFDPQHHPPTQQRRDCFDRKKKKKEEVGLCGFL